MKVYLDAGHGGKDSGAVGNGETEANNALTLALKVNEEMNKRGHVTMMSRMSDVYPPSNSASQSESLNYRAESANNFGADVFISFHMNAYDDTSANGIEVLYGRNSSRKSRDIAAKMCDAIATVGFRNRGSKKQGATVLEKTTMPAVTLENGFITNIGDLNTYKNNIISIANIICDVLESFFGKGNVPEKPTTPTEPQPSNVATVIYRTYFNTQQNTIGEGENVTVIENENGSDFVRVQRSNGEIGVIIRKALKL
jgi:N-acetylmuramoyl-L-alanine amidase